MDDFVSFSDVYTHFIFNSFDSTIYTDTNININRLNEDSLHIDRKDYKDDNTSNTVDIDVDTYLKNIFISYNNCIDDVWNQFRLDLPRTPIRLFDLEDNIKTVDEFKQLTDCWKDKQIIVNDVLIDLQSFFSMMCNQSSFCFPFLIVHRLYSKPEKNRYVCATADKRQVHIKSKESIQLTSMYNVVNVDTLEVLKSVHTVLTVNILSDVLKVATLTWSLIHL